MTKGESVMFGRAVVFTLIALLTAGSSLLIAKPGPMAMMAQATNTSATNGTDTTASGTTDTAATDSAATDTAATDTTATIKAPAKLNYAVEESGTISARGNFPNAVKVRAATDEVQPKPVAGVKIKGTIRKGEGAQLYEKDKDGKIVESGQSVTIPTDTAGVATFGLFTEDETNITVQFTPMDGDTEIVNKIELHKLSATAPFVSSVIDAGLRIDALSNEVFPIYVGGHLNTGPGEDDLRLFLGMLVKLDLLGRLVQGVVPAPQ
jgi:hypothetical protein